MPAFVAVYSGDTISTARLVAVSADPALVRDITDRLLHGSEPAENPVAQQVEQGRRAALRLIRQEVTDGGR